MNRELFRHYWRFEFKPQIKFLTTPLFSLLYLRGFESWETQQAYEFGWRLYFWPVDWTFSKLKEGDLMWRKKFERVVTLYIHQ